MKHLTDQIHSSRSALHPIELAAMAHKRLVDIHPFVDGNGRTARLLMSLVCGVRSGLPCVRMSLQSRAADNNFFYRQRKNQNRIIRQQDYGQPPTERK
ncbi:MAG: Fic family protein [Eubacterium sp.]|nr:Fic family protein [Eubacterium sp.]